MTNYDGNSTMNDYFDYTTGTSMKNDFADGSTHIHPNSRERSTANTNSINGPVTSGLYYQNTTNVGIPGPNTTTNSSKSFPTTVPDSTSNSVDVNDSYFQKKLNEIQAIDPFQDVHSNDMNHPHNVQNSRLLNRSQIRDLPSHNQTPYHVSNQNPNLIPIQVANIPNQTPNQIPMQIANQIPNQLPNQMSNQMPNQMSNHIPSQITNQVSNQPNYMSNQIHNYAANLTPNASNQIANPMLHQSMQLISEAPPPVGTQYPSNYTNFVLESYDYNKYYAEAKPPAKPQSSQFYANQNHNYSTFKSVTQKSQPKEHAKNKPKQASYGSRSKKPKFHIDLNNISNMNPSNSNGHFDHNHYHNIMNHGPSTTGNIPIQLPAKLDISPKSESGLDDLWNSRGIDDDLINFGQDLDTNSHLFMDSANIDFISNITSMTGSNMTPGLKPPGTDQHAYFDTSTKSSLYKSEISKPPSSIGLGSQQVFFSPQINYNEATLNNFSQNFEQYLSDTRKHEKSKESFATVPSDAQTSDDSEFVKQTKFNFEATIDRTSDINDTTDNYKYTSKNTFVANSISNGDPNEEHQRKSGEFYPLFKQIDENFQSNTINEGYNFPTTDFKQFTVEENDKQNEDKYDSELTAFTIERTSSNNSNGSNNSIPTQTTCINSKPKKKRNPKGAVCSVCDKYISRDLTRHMRIHNEVGRFHCVYPKFMCNHKTQYFNRPYDYKKHLLHMHFKFDDPTGKAANTLTDKLPLHGSCLACDKRFIANDWLNDHVLTTDLKARCAFVEDKESDNIRAAQEN